ncbi:MAG: hypothetical protein HKN21_01905 [Candidatus Eisenbacteria bacterium]|uniref:Intracellular proteinase inhibitor BsuPI domain-containing protein n=1 Tax=Eiseniibacteriota bacterium TaxID=2212470 RepID=A0A7Y2E700_UNCEI|nr:hypothetical protein [Candidatus Eisenbacteria bacterium]
MCRILCLVAVAAVLNAPKAISCELPPHFENTTIVEESGIRVILATDLEHYSPGSEVTFYLSVTNLGDEVVSFYSPAWPMQMFSVLPGGCTDLYQEGCLDHVVFMHPEVVYFPGDSVTLDPGECSSWTHQWDGLTQDEDTGEYRVPAEGLYSVIGGLYEYQGYPNPILFVAPPGGALLTISLGDVSVGAESASWGHIKSRYN